MYSQITVLNQLSLSLERPIHLEEETLKQKKLLVALEKKKERKRTWCTPPPGICLHDKKTQWARKCSLTLVTTGVNIRGCSREICNILHAEVGIPL